MVMIIKILLLWLISLLLRKSTKALIIAAVGMFNGYELCFMLRGCLFIRALKGSFVYDCVLPLSRYLINSLYCPPCHIFSLSVSLSSSALLSSGASSLLFMS